MKKAFEAAQIELITFEMTDIITTSGFNGFDDGVETGE